jgi:hypothetical protein
MTCLSAPWKLIGVFDLLLLAYSAYGQSSNGWLNYVNPLIGTANGGPLTTPFRVEKILTSTGHVFAGATLPRGEK